MSGLEHGCRYRELAQVIRANAAGTRREGVLVSERGDELSVLLKKLAHAPRVYVRSGRLPATSGGASGVLAAVAAEVHTLVRRLHREDWQQWASDPTGPASVREVEEALEPIDGDSAAALMGTLATECLVWSGATFMERAEADEVAGRVVDLLGTDARWWSNRDGDSWTAVTACTFDSLVACTDGRRFAVLIQVGED
ncbi:hypothetical protein [Streptomyces sp. NPDC005538]|uniref:hypothetical protein n=1 Tax=unclassified Streptomyces TaxID=2593676 RepID=UPI0033A0DC07